MTNGTGTIQVDGVPRFYVVFMTTRFQPFPGVQREAPEQLAEHVAMPKRLHREGVLLMAGAFVERPGQPVRTMGVLVPLAWPSVTRRMILSSAPASSRSGTSGSGRTSSVHSLPFSWPWCYCRMRVSSPGVPAWFLPPSRS